MPSYRKLRSGGPFLSLCPPSLHLNTQSLLMVALWTNKLFSKLKHVYILLLTGDVHTALQRKQPSLWPGLKPKPATLPSLCHLERRYLFPSTILFITSPDENCHIPFPLRLSGIYSLATELRERNLVQL